MTFVLVKSRLRQSPYDEKDLARALNREIVPTLAEVVRRFNALELGDLGFLLVSATGNRDAEAFDFIDYNDAALGPITVTLPAMRDRGDVVRVKAPPNAGVFNLTVSGGATLIDGAATFVMATNNQSAAFVFNGVQWRVF